MAQSLAKIIVHVVFTTQGRCPFLQGAALREETHRYLGRILNRLECHPIIIGGTEDPVHLLASLSRTCDAATMVKELKRGTAIWLKSRSPELRKFSWQHGYGIFSIGHSQIGVTQKYIAKQEEHHRKMSFQDKFRKFLHRYEIPFDERYVWD